MEYLYSPSRRGFYVAGVHSDIPGDVAEVSDEAHAALMSEQALGKVIVPGDGGVPMAQSVPSPTAADLIRLQITALELQQTPRRMREAALGADGGWLASLDAQIQALRKQLT